MAALDEFRRVTHGTGGVLEENLLLLLAHQAEKLSGLGVVIIIILTEIPTVHSAKHIQRRLFKLRLFLPDAEAVGVVAQG